MTSSSPLRRGKDRLVSGVASVGWSRREWLLVGLATLIGAAIRIAWQLDRPFVNDEVGTLGLLGKSYSAILTEWGSTQTQHYFLLLLRVMFDLSGSQSWGLVLIPFLCGVLTVPATALLGAALGERRTGVLACALAATNPYLISRTGMIRAYPVQIFLAVVLLWLFALWWAHRSMFRGVAVATTTCLLALMHPNSALLFVALAICASAAEGARLLSNEGTHRGVIASLKSWVTLAGPMAVAAIATIVAYLPVFRSPEQPSWTELQPPGRTVIGHTPLGIAFLDDIWPRYFGDNYLAWPTTIAFLAGALLLIRERTRMRAAVLLLTVLAFVVSARGVHALHPSANARWLAFALPVLVLVIAFAADRTRSLTRQGFLPWLVVFAVVASWQPNLASLFESKKQHPWNDVRSDLGSRSSPPLAMALGTSTFINLGPPNRTDYDYVAIRPLGVWTSEDHIGGFSFDRETLLVHVGVDLACGDRVTRALGRIHITEFSASSPADLRNQVFDCLFDTATRTWAASPEMMPIYDFLLTHGQDRGRPEFRNRFTQLRDAARSQTAFEWHKPMNKRRSEAKKLEQRFLRLHPR